MPFLNTGAHTHDAHSPRESRAHFPHPRSITHFLASPSGEFRAVHTLITRTTRPTCQCSTDNEFLQPPMLTTPAHNLASTLTFRCPQTSSVSPRDTLRPIGFLWAFALFRATGVRRTELLCKRLTSELRQRLWCCRSCTRAVHLIPHQTLAQLHTDMSNIAV